MYKKKSNCYYSEFHTYSEFHIYIYIYLACSVSKILGTCKVLCKVQNTRESSFPLLYVFQGKNAFHEEEILLRSNVY